VQKHVHQAEPPRVGDDLIAKEGLMFQESLLRLVQLVVGQQVIIGRKEEAASAAGIRAGRSKRVWES
jgi:hypothetical protein